VPQDHFCAITFNMTSYARSVAHSNAYLVDGLRNVQLRLQQLDDVMPFCNVSLNSAICFYQFPPCEDFKLLPTCSESCSIFLSYIQECFKVLINPVEDIFLITHFTKFGCDDFSYYSDYNQSYFSTTKCYSSLPVPPPEEEKEGYCMCVYSIFSAMMTNATGLQCMRYLGRCLIAYHLDPKFNVASIQHYSHHLVLLNNLKPFFTTDCGRLFKMQLLA